MTNYAAQAPGVAGTVRSMNAAAAADSFTNDGHTMLYIENGSGAPITLTLDDPNTPTPPGATAFNADAAITVAAGAKAFAGPFPPSRFNDANGRAQMAWSATATVTWAAVTSAT